MIQRALATFFLGVFLILAPTVSAEDYPTQAQINGALISLPHVRFAPDSFLYSLIKFKEKLSWLTKPNPASKAKFDLISSGKRVKESYLMAQKANFQESKNAISSYCDTVSKTVSETEKAQNQSQDTAALLNSIQNSFWAQKIILDKMASEEKIREEAKDELSEAQKCLSDSAEKLKNLRPDIYVPFKDSTQSAS